MLNDKIFKPNNEICLKCDYQLKQKTTSREKMLHLIKSVFFEKWIWSFETLNSTFYAYKHILWYKMSVRGQWGHSGTNKSS